MDTKSWMEHARPGHAHDPNEVTVQIDGVGAVLAERLERSAAPADRPVFVDVSGRRSRRYRTFGTGLVLCCVVATGAVAATVLSTSSAAPWTPLHRGPDRTGGEQAGPADSTSIPGAPATVPTPSPSAADGSTAPSAENEPVVAGSPEPGDSATEDPAAAPSVDATRQPDPSRSTRDPQPDPAPSTPAPAPSAEDTGAPGGSGGPDTTAAPVTAPGIAHESRT